MATLKSLFRCEAAGRENNEDNGKIIRLGGDKGELLLVCDGMGGMEAGEVASALAVATIEEWFTPERISASVLSNPAAYMMQAIVGADTNIKEYTKKDPKTAGMGSTIVMAWVIGQKVYVAWCGDSRAYRYNPQLGLERLSRDHSLVQTWVDAGQITEDQAFDHPQSNIITRSLGDPNGEALPEAAAYDLYNGDVLLLCSDGLCGTLRDREIEAIMTENDDLTKCCDQLWQADEAAGWHDNVTTAMAQVVAGGVVLAVAQPEPVDNGIEVLSEESAAAPATPTPTPAPTSVPAPSTPMVADPLPQEPIAETEEDKEEAAIRVSPAMYKKLIYICIAVLVLIVGIILIRKHQAKKPEPKKQEIEQPITPARQQPTRHTAPVDEVNTNPGNSEQPQPSQQQVPSRVEATGTTGSQTGGTGKVESNKPQKEPVTKPTKAEENNSSNPDDNQAQQPSRKTGTTLKVEGYTGGGKTNTNSSSPANEDGAQTQGSASTQSSASAAPASAAPATTSAPQENKSDSETKEDEK